MPSSTSSSERRAWLSTWALAVALVLALLGGWELTWRARGFRPSVRDDQALWAAARRQLREGDPHSVVVLGSSRIQLGIDLDELARATGWRRPLQLAIAMGPTVPMLRHVARDTDFSGIAIAEVNPRLFFEDPRSLDFRVASYLRAYRHFTWSDAFEQRLRARVQEALVLRLPDLSPPQLQRALSSGRWPRPSHIAVLRDRSRHADFSLLPDLDARTHRTKQLRQQSMSRFLSPERLEKWLHHVETLVKILRDRGGDVVFLNMPTSGFIRENERETVPRATYWDALAASTTALAIHFEDHPELAGFRAPDGGHLDMRDTPLFSRALGGT